MLTDTQTELRQAQSASAVAWQATANTPQSPPAPAPDPCQKAKMTPEELRRRIAEAAYFKAEQRDFIPGHEEVDWVAAEQEIKALADYWLP